MNKLLTIARAASNQLPPPHMACLHNDTDCPLNSEYLETGGKTRIDASVRSEAIWNIWWTNAPSRPTLPVRFDSDVSEGTSGVRMNLTLYRGGTHDCDVSEKDGYFDGDFSDCIRRHDHYDHPERDAR